MGRAPCCDKVGLKKGPWTPKEDQILISFIKKHGHSNWRALPKQAGLLRCGKSCRLRWINYLKPDIKRGNFTNEEEETIIKLHEMMGNRWSAIAARLPGRTDNEIKNVWHTHLKKRLPTFTNNFPETSRGTSDHVPTSSQQSYSSEGFSSITEVSSMEVPQNDVVVANHEKSLDSQQYSSLDYFSVIDETFWSSQELSINDYDMSNDDNQLQFSVLEDNLSGAYNNFSIIYNENGQVNYEDNMDFWYDVFVKASGATELPDF